MDGKEGCAELSDLQKLLERERELEKAIQLIDNLHGRNPWHEHQQTFFYFKGYLDAIKWFSHLKDL